MNRFDPTSIRGTLATVDLLPVCCCYVFIVEVQVGLMDLMRSMPLPMPHGYTVSATRRIEGSFEVRTPSHPTNRLNWRPIFLAFMLRIHNIVPFNWYILL